MVESTNPKWESYILGFSFFLYVVWQVNAIFHHGSYGQDFGAHLTWIRMAEADPIHWLTTYDGGRTNPPMFHFLASLIFKIVGGNDYRSLEVVALFSMIANAIALFFLYRIIKQLILVPSMRLACMVLILFLPFAMITAVVLAADSLATPCFLFLVYLFSLLTKERSKASFIAILSAITLLFMLALTIKFTFIALAPASVCLFIVLYQTKHLSRKRAMAGVLTMLLLPSTFGAFQLHYYHSQVKYNLGIPQVWQNPIDSPFMNLRSLLMVKPIDKKLLDAPPYNVSDDGETFALLQPNRYSYPGLLHLAMYTDILNIYQYSPVKNTYFGPRSSHAQKRMEISVKTGLFFTVLAAITVPLMILLCMLQVLRKRGDFWGTIAILTLFSCAFCLVLIVFFPQIKGVYGGGYWLPRLIAPALICFFVTAFAFVDRFILKRFPGLGLFFLVIVIMQSFLHLSFLWPWNWERVSVAKVDNASLTNTGPPEPMMTSELFKKTNFS